ncbi:hypothetical protein HLB23_11255 [Nocardia uniformis]|uniref:Uncharacterized protein n=1 Tax=Nocardia uniformis TaxID=53432 RepID=A0A849CBU1_9NOCA|nr:hypothetical protein [Nocardia uniformis]NNH70431.1 hypothetical protein [Nocardia uniformis]
MKSRIRSAAGAILLLTAAVLPVSCAESHPGRDANPVAQLDVERVRVPQWMRRSQPVVSVGRIIAGEAGLPWITGGSVAHPDSGATPTVWLSDDAVTWTRTPVTPEFSGSFRGVLRGGRELVALAGGVWSDGSVVSRLWTSVDRRHWTQTPLPDDFARRYRITDAYVAGESIVVTGSDQRGAARALRLDHDGANTSLIELPDPGNDAVLGVKDILGEGNSLVLVASPGPEGVPAATVSYRSIDGGKTRDAPATIADQSGHFAGVVWTGTEYVATGATRRDTSPTAPRVPAAWVSRDGAAWRHEAVPAPPTESHFRIDGSLPTWLGVPTTRDGVVTVVAAGQTAPGSALFRRGLDHEWNYLGETTVNSDTGVGGTAITVGDNTVTAILGSGATRFGRLTGTTWTDGQTLSTRDDAFDKTAPLASQQALLRTQRSTFTARPDWGYTSAGEGRLVQLVGDRLEERSWDPPDAAGLLNTRMVSDDDGATITLGTRFTGDQNIVQGWYRPNSRAGWQTIQGFGTTGSTVITTVRKTGAIWTAVGVVRANVDLETSDHAAAWTSTNGRDWVREVGEFGNGPLRSSIDDVCTLPDGSSLGVGWTEISQGRYQPAAWRARPEGWQRIRLGGLGDGDGSIGGCAVSGISIIVGARTEGRTVVLRSENGTDWTEVARAETGQTIGVPVAVPGGFAATGSWSDATHISPALWLSADGITWTPRRVLSVRDGSTATVSVYGDDLLVTMNPLIGDPLVIIRHSARVVADASTR